MARGITETDVFTACDALLLAGERPTIERVRQKIGRGSPNTVSPMLDAWFKGLGRRLHDPGAFAPLPDIPEPVMQAAQHFWEVAQVGARVDVEAKVLERLAPMQSELDQAQHVAALATAQKDAAINRNRDAQEKHAEAVDRLDFERTTHAATAARLEVAERHNNELNNRLLAAEAELRAAHERTQLETTAAHERASGAERRAALEIENERMARVKADKRAEGHQKRVDELQERAASLVEELVKTQATLDHERVTVARMQSALEASTQERKAIDAALVEARVATARAEAQAKTTEVTMAQLLPLIAQPKKVTKPHPSHKRIPD